MLHLHNQQFSFIPGFGMLSLCEEDLRSLQGDYPIPSAFCRFTETK